MVDGVSVPDHPAWNQCDRTNMLRFLSIDQEVSVKQDQGKETQAKE